MKSFVEAMNEKLDGLSSHVIKFKVAVSKYTLAQLSTPIYLFLSNSHIAYAFHSESEFEEVKRKCAEVVELDLMGNHLNWSETFKIIDRLPKLSILNLSVNSLGPMGPIDGLKAYPRLRTIILNQTKIAWSDVNQLIKIMPQLKELHLSLNDYTTVGIDTLNSDEGIQIVSKHENIERLFLDKNLFRDWNEVMRFGRIFPKLRSLSLPCCPIESLACGMADITTTFPELDYLNLNDAKLESWNDILQLIKFKKLRKLSIRRLPLFDAYSQHAVRRLVVGILPALETLNNSMILCEDRGELLKIESQSHTLLN